MMLSEIRNKVSYWINCDRLGPDIPVTHWRLHFRSTMERLCRKKFRKFGQGAEFRAGAYAVGCSQIEIGQRVVIRPGTKLFGETSDSGDVSIRIEDDVMMGCGVHIYVSNHRFDRMDIPLIDQGHYPARHVILRKGCWIGANAIILPGVEIGENTVVGAGSVVTKSFPTGMVVAGNPAKVIKAIAVNGVNVK